MNQKKTKSPSQFQKTLIAFLLSVPLAVGTFLLCAYLFQNVPKYQAYLSYFPWAYSFVLSLAVLLLSIIFRFPSVLQPALISTFLSLSTGIWALIFMTENIRFFGFIGIRILFVLLSVLLYFLYLHKKSRKPGVTKRPNFKK